MRLFLLLAALSAAAPAYAQQQKPSQRSQIVLPESNGRRVPPGTPVATIIAEPVAMTIAAFDTDGDARVTRAEFEAGVKHSFESIDTAHKGVIGFIAFSDWSERWVGNRNALPNPFEVDSDGDNRITLAELEARFDLFFARFDSDKDGVIVRSELLSVRTPMDRGRGRRKGMPGQDE